MDVNHGKAYQQNQNSGEIYNADKISIENFKNKIVQISVEGIKTCKFKLDNPYKGLKLY